MYPLKYLPIQAQLVVTKCHYAGEECHMALVGWQKLKRRRWRGPALSLPKDYLDFLSKSLRSAFSAFSAIFSVKSLMTLLKKRTAEAQRTQRIKSSQRNLCALRVSAVKLTFFQRTHLIG